MARHYPDVPFPRKRERMRPHKTDLARQTLQAHGGTLSMRERRALILCDGQRSVEELVALLGPDAPLLLQRLARTGHVSLGDAAPASASLAPASAPAPAGPRRSLIAARLYLMGMLELQRGDQAASHRRHLQASHDDAGTLDALLASMRFLQSCVAVSLAQRIRERLAEVLPEEHLHALDAAVPWEPGPALA